jgi:hypothetical protein
MSSEQIETLLPRRKCADEIGVTVRSVCRYEKLRLPGFDTPVKINGRTFHPRSAIEAVKRFGIALPAKEA